MSAMSRKERRNLIRIAVALGLFAAVFTADKIVGLGGVFKGSASWLFPFALYLAIYLLIGYDVLWRAARNIAHGQIFDENFLMCIATLGAFALAVSRGVTGRQRCLAVRSEPPIWKCSWKKPWNLRKPVIEAYSTSAATWSSCKNIR